MRSTRSFDVFASPLCCRRSAIELSLPARGLALECHDVEVGRRVLRGTSAPTLRFDNGADVGEHLVDRMIRLVPEWVDIGQRLSEDDDDVSEPQRKRIGVGRDQCFSRPGERLCVRRVTIGSPPGMGPRRRRVGNNERHLHLGTNDSGDLPADEHAPGLVERPLRGGESDASGRIQG